MSNKRFQECSKLEQIWRYRWYLLIPFEWCIIKFNCIRYKEDLSNKNIWSLCIGIMQGHMKWYYTWDEVKKTLKKRKT